MTSPDAILRAMDGTTGLALAIPRRVHERDKAFGDASLHDAGLKVQAMGSPADGPWGRAADFGWVVVVRDGDRVVPWLLEALEGSGADGEVLELDRLVCGVTAAYEPAGARHTDWGVAVRGKDAERVAELPRRPLHGLLYVAFEPRG